MQARNKYMKSFTELPVHVDFPRLFPLISIVDRNKNVIWEEKKTIDNLVSNILDFFVVLDKQLNLGKEEEIKKRFYEFVPPGLDPTNSELPSGLKEFISQVFTDNSTIVSILKCINQAIIVPAVTILKVTFMNAKINYFEIRGKWNVIINVGDDKITIINKRWERSAPEIFHFCWEIEYILNKETKELMDTKLFISEISYLTEVTQDEKLRLLDVLKDLYKPVKS
jgi:hypothetical protein